MPPGPYLLPVHFPPDPGRSGDAGTRATFFRNGGGMDHLGWTPPWVEPPREPERRASLLDGMPRV